ncbi:hypothetical protein H8S20_04950 [Clostridium sp. NSJ-6]|uniref:Uncharacterized protein n=1 Tax=Clostridium hominis TaxID=2763036 RepID=A0ABR7DA76_9CLOT|nr:hypothetical protein [Clostridium hominis]MBC5628237.1 hypothetical protein [Clostridium hominis]MDU2671413.1 hypothetical protein [Clostridium sp.]SCI71520.1 Uncharacterised protein [uncultured Clostridium sp.]
MGHKPSAKEELKAALNDVIYAQSLLYEAIDIVEDNDNKQLLQNTLSNVNEALSATKTSTYGFKY